MSSRKAGISGLLFPGSHFFQVFIPHPSPPHQTPLSLSEHLETLHLHAAPIKLHALRLVIKGIDPLNLYELQFVPATHPVRRVGTHGAVCVLVCVKERALLCVCVCCAVVRKRGKGFYRHWRTLLTSCE